ncbi:YjbQ family protein [Pseudodesulfovibrio sp. JC047]|uniref:secondary thiamine-phosphate synthase enzyme YjbQ n=1 Tax=Pseudodesulfovibrio sp. JC047 TaxID=2683199 RepID=UPI0013D70E98|nr:YjbQ family protein [Pseudodesulfovibrio sp. JC047]
METLRVQTRSREAMVDITQAVQQRIREKGWSDGVLMVYCPHTTGAITINEGADPDVVRDILVNLRALVPLHGDYLHAEGNSDAHIKSSLFGCDQHVIVADGVLQLGTWQKLYFCEFDGPRTRTVWMQWMASTCEQ